jgi:hypothetical protein
MDLKDVPKNIIEALEEGPAWLDDLVHAAKSHEASTINNQGYLSQLGYLIGEEYLEMDTIAAIVLGGDRGEYCPQCAKRHEQEDIDGGRCLACGRMLCGIPPVR